MYADFKEIAKARKFAINLIIQTHCRAVDVIECNPKLVFIGSVVKKDDKCIWVTSNSSHELNKDGTFRKRRACHVS